MGAVTTTIFNLYLAVVCAFSLLACVIIGGSGLSGAVNLVYPNPVEISTTRFDDTTKTEVARDPAIIAAERAERALSQRGYAIQGMLHSFVYFLLAGTVFAVHWRIFRRRVALVDMLSQAEKPTKTKSK